MATILTEADGHLGTVTVNQPEKRKPEFKGE
jgi:hypothetical protein